LEKEGKMRLLIIPLLLLTAIMTSAQTRTEATTTDGKRVWLNPNGTWELISNENNSSQSNKDKVVPLEDFATGITPEKVELFFDDYTGKQLKFTVWLGTVEITEDRTGKAYGILVKSEDGKIFTPKIYKRPIKTLNFVLSEDMARKTIEAQEQLTNTRDGRANETVLRGANIYTDIYKYGDYNGAVIVCIEFIGSELKKGSESKKGSVREVIIKSVGC
jgi:hypothetical protein